MSRRPRGSVSPVATSQEEGGRGRQGTEAGLELRRRNWAGPESVSPENFGTDHQVHALKGMLRGIHGYCGNMAILVHMQEVIIVSLVEPPPVQQHKKVCCARLVRCGLSQDPSRQPESPSSGWTTLKAASADTAMRRRQRGEIVLELLGTIAGAAAKEAQARAGNSRRLAEKSTRPATLSHHFGNSSSRKLRPLARFSVTQKALDELVLAQQPPNVCEPPAKVLREGAERRGGHVEESERDSVNNSGATAEPPENPESRYVGCGRRV